MRSRVVVCLLLAMVLAGCDAAPDPVATLKQTYAERPVVADDDNAFLDAFGFLGLPDVDAHGLGLQRVAWYKKFRADPKTAGTDPGKDGLDAKASHSQEMNQIVDACSAGAARACGSALGRVKADTTLSTIEPLLLARYEVLLGRRGWMDIGIYSAKAPLPPYQGIIDAQRLMLIRLADKARAGDVETVRATLSRDLDYWRRMFASSDALISKMIALAGIRQHFSFGSYVLRNLPADRVMDAVPDQWRVEFSATELSLLRVASGELMFVDEAFREERESREKDGDSADEKVESLEGLFSGLTGRKKTRQLSLDETASYLLAVAETYRPPLSSYQASTQKLRDEHHHVVSSGMDMSQYAVRAGGAECMRRAALLTVTLRSQGVPASEVARNLEQSALKNPFDGKPFVWDAADQAVVFIGSASDRYRRQAYPY